jgi:16S rRNA (cytosine967-C5)-methyltransferase
MRPGARVAAAIDVLDDIATRHRPAAEALKDWGRAHRFAGSGDRAAIGDLVFDALRRKSSLAWAMGDDSSRAIALGALRHVWGSSVAEIESFADGSTHAPPPLTETERTALADPRAGRPPLHVAGDFPEWLAPQFDAAYADAHLEGAALATRAPVYLRANTLKADRGKVLKALAKLGATETPWSPLGLRIAHKPGPARAPHVEAEPAHGKGWFEVQDEGSQLAALLAGARQGMQVLDLCAGAGGKTLALAASMENKGQIYAHDSDKLRLRPIFERLKRAGLRNAQVIGADDAAALDALADRMDVVLIDAPCTGSGVWRRRPDAKWRLTQEQLDARVEEQKALIDRGASFVKPGGVLVYVTCSMLPRENEGQIAAFMRANRDDFDVVPWAEQWRAVIGADRPPPATTRDDALQLTPRRHGTDGFFVCVLRRKDG